MGYYYILLKSVFSLIALLLIIMEPAHAYLDPGTGSMILQGVIASIAVAGFTLKTYWYKVRSMFGQRQSASLLEDEDEPENDDDVAK